MAQKANRIAVLMGGPSSEHEVSLSSGSEVVSALQPDRQVEPVVIGHDRRWAFADGELLSVGAALERLSRSVDVVFPALHGPFGEDGVVQALLDAIALPYVGSTTAVSAVAMNKAIAKQVYREAELPTPASRYVRPAERSEVAAYIDALFPCVIKPTNAGSSVGISLPKTREEGIQQVIALLDAENHVLIEEAITGREFSGGVFERMDDVVALPVTEIIPADGYAFFDYEAKYTPGATDEVTPANIPKGLSTGLQQLAVRAHQALGCRDISRTDFMVRGDEIFLLETNTLPGLTSGSLFPQGAIAAGISFCTLVAELVDRAYRRGPKQAW